MWEIHSTTVHEHGNAIVALFWVICAMLNRTPSWFVKDWFTFRMG